MNIATVTNHFNGMRFQKVNETMLFPYYETWLYMYGQGYKMTDDIYSFTERRNFRSYNEN